MTNYEKWYSYTLGLPSPDNFIRWSWYSTVAACLQRRVWMPPEHDKIYGNMFIAFVADPGVGKGVIRYVKDILSQYKLKDFKEEMMAKQGMSDDEKFMAQKIAEKTLSEAQEQMEKGSTNKAALDHALVIPLGADASTYEALVQTMAQSYRYINWVGFDEKIQKSKMNVYGHSSMTIPLEEMSSLFRKNTQSLVNFLIQAYDCGENYEYKIKTGASDRIRRVCLNFLAGTTPDFMQSTFEDELTNQGFASRTFYIFAIKNRKSMFFRPELTKEQSQHKIEISQHLRKLTSLYGQVEIKQEVFEFLQNWIEADSINTDKRASQSNKMKGYYARKNIHIMKVAMAIHFGESVEMAIPLTTFQQAISVLHEEEKTMSLALTVGQKNPLAKVSDKVCKYLSIVGKKSFNELLVEFWNDCKKPELEEVLNYLQATEQIVTRQEESPITQQTHIVYMIKKV